MTHLVTITIDLRLDGNGNVIHTHLTEGTYTNRGYIEPDHVQFVTQVLVDIGDRGIKQEVVSLERATVAGRIIDGAKE